LRFIITCLAIISIIILAATPFGYALETVQVTGSSTVMPIAARSAEIFNNQQKEIRVTVTGGGSGHGIEAVATGKADIGMASREVTASEIENFGNRFVEHVIAKDAVAVVISSDIYSAGVTGLTKEEIRKIFNGEIKNWNEVGGPNRWIAVIVRKPGSGTRDTFMEAIFGTALAKENGQDVAVSENAEMMMNIVNKNNAIGYLSIGYLNENVKAIAVDGTLPTEKNVYSEKYPITRDLYFYTFGDPSTKVQKFIDFVLGPEGQKIVGEEGYLPIK